MCVPTDSKLYAKIFAFVKLDYISESFSEIKTAWPNYIIAFVIALIICLIYFFLMRFLAGCILWIMILGTLVGFFLGGGLLYHKYQTLSNKGSDGSNFKNLAIFLWVLGGIFLLFIFCICG